MGYYLLICLSCFFFKIHGVVLSLSQSVTLPSRIMDCQLLIAFHVSPWDCMQHLFAFTRSCFALENTFMVVLTNKNIEKGILHRDGFFDILIHLCSTWVPRSVIFKQKFNKCDTILTWQQPCSIPLLSKVTIYPTGLDYHGCRPTLRLVTFGLLITVDTIATNPHGHTMVELNNWSNMHRLLWLHE